MKTMIILGALLVLGILTLRWRNHRKDEQYSNRKANRVGLLQFAVVVAVMLMLLAAVSHRHNASATDGGGTTTTTPSAGTLKCPADASDTAYKLAASPDYGLDSGEKFAATGGTLIGDGKSVVGNDPQVAAQAIFDLGSRNPMFLAKLAYALRVPGFTPGTEVRGQVSVTVSFLDSRAQALRDDRNLWRQTRRDVCLRMKAGSGNVEPDWKDRNVLELASRPVDGQSLPVTVVLLDRDPRPDGLRLYFVWRQVDSTGERPNSFPVAVDLQYMWPVIVGEVPESAEKQAPSTTTTTSSSTATTESPSTSSQGQQGNKGGTPSKNPSGPGTGTSCGGSCGSAGQSGGPGTTGPGTTTGGSGSGGSGGGSGSGGGGGGCSGTSCPGGGGGSSSTTTTRPTTSTTRPPSTTTTTVPTTSTTRPPTTVPPTTTPTTVPPSTTTTVAPKDPPPPCFPQIPYPDPGSCPPPS